VLLLPSLLQLLLLQAPLRKVCLLHNTVITFC
jgi:hypothetical protein